MTAFERLLNAGYHLDVFQWNDGRERGIGVHFQNCEIKDGAFLVSEFERGVTLNDACEDYIRKISGKTLIFHAYSDRREEILAI